MITFIYESQRVSYLMLCYRSTKYICIWEWWEITNEQLIVKCSAWVTIANHKKRKNHRRAYTHIHRDAYAAFHVYTPILQHSTKAHKTSANEAFLMVETELDKYVYFVLWFACFCSFLCLKLCWKSNFQTTNVPISKEASDKPFSIMAFVWLNVWVCLWVCVFLWPCVCTFPP